MFIILVYQVFIGNQGRPTRPATVNLVDNFNSMEVDMLVALYVDYIPHRPQIARLLEKDEEKMVISVHWFSSSWTGPCKPRHTGSGSNRRPLTELLDLRTAIFWDFSRYREKGLSDQNNIEPDTIEICRN